MKITDEAVDAVAHAYIARVDGEDRVPLHPALERSLQIQARQYARAFLEAALPHLTDDGATDTPPPVAAGAESATSTVAPSSPHHEAAARITEFLRQWSLMRDRGDSIYAVHADVDADPADLLASDIRAVLPGEGATPAQEVTDEDIRIAAEQADEWRAGLSEGATPAIDREAPTRSQIAEALRKEGAYCGDCDFEDDWTLCARCRAVLGDYADAVLKLLDGAR